MRASTIVRTLLSGMALASLSLSVGCGPRTGHVWGKVSLKGGKPLTGGTLTFFPQELGRVHPVSVVIKPDGTYDAPAVPTGQVKVAVSTVDLDPNAPTPRKAYLGGKEPGGKGGMGPPKDVMKDKQIPGEETPKLEGTFIPILPKFANPEESGWTLEVTTGDQEFNINDIIVADRKK